MSNSDPFSHIADQWWDPNGPMKPLHDINPTRCTFITNQLDSTNLKGIDIGCGGGILTEMLAKTHRMTGIDISKPLINKAICHAKAQHLKINYHHKDAQSMTSSAEASYDFVTCLEMLEHVESPQSVITQCAHMTKPNGMIFFSTINRNPLALLTAIVGAEYVLGILPKGTHQYEKLIKPSELDAMCRQVGLVKKTIKGMAYNPFSGDCWLISSPAVNYITCYQKI